MVAGMPTAQRKSGSSAEEEFGWIEGRHGVQQRRSTTAAHSVLYALYF